MINKLTINNFKSIKSLGLDCKRLNLFIGEPNVGKSNILEALGFFSWVFYHNYGELGEFVRFERVSNLFYDETIADNLSIGIDNSILTLGFKNGNFSGMASQEKEWAANFQGDYRNLSLGGYSAHFKDGQGDVKFYRFAIRQLFKRLESEFLLPPSGENLLSLLMTHKDMRTEANQIFVPYGLRLILKPQENRIEVRKQLEDVDISYPYSIVSDTLQRMVFYICAILSNKNSTLVFEEPEAHAFPFYTKQMAEMIAMDDGNQYFISTHNPYFLGPIIEKSKKADIAVFIVYFDNYQTKVRPLEAGEIEEIMEIDVFSNLDRYLKVK
ncbi:MAG: AAA family ATPase [Chloroflexota bacterium]